MKMKKISEKQGLRQLHRLKTDYRDRIKTDYEDAAKDCITCETKGACCLDAHFVNVHISRLEAAAIRMVLSRLPVNTQAETYRRIDEAIVKYNLTDKGDTFSQTYACPLFEKGIGCLVHEEGKPLPCIQHACYENQEDLPPDELLDVQEGLVDRLNWRTYGTLTQWLPLPVAIKSSGRSG